MTNTQIETDDALVASRRQILVGGAALATAAAVGIGRARAADDASADFLFVQTAKGLSHADGKLTLTDVSPITLFFADRPDRIAGNMSTARFVPFWSEGKDSFLSDPPNADLSILKDGKLVQTVVVLKDPAIDGDNLSYSVSIIDGEIPASAEDVSVFIDIIGMPLTPVSFAGADRRAFRRAVMY